MSQKGFEDLFEDAELGGLERATVLEALRQNHRQLSERRDALTSTPKPELFRRQLLDLKYALENRALQCLTIKVDAITMELMRSRIVISAAVKAFEGAASRYRWLVARGPRAKDYEVYYEALRTELKTQLDWLEAVLPEYP